MMKNKKKFITAEDMHDLVLNLPIDEYYSLFQLMFTHITNFIYEAEQLANKYNQRLKDSQSNDTI